MAVGRGGFIWRTHRPTDLGVGGLPGNTTPPSPREGGWPGNTTPPSPRANVRPGNTNRRRPVGGPGGDRWVGGRGSLLIQAARDSHAQNARGSKQSPGGGWWWRSG
eukprot:g17750.t1